MNVVQMVRQARYLLLARQWPDSPTEYVFGQDGGDLAGAVRITNGGYEDSALAELRRPFALLSVDEAVADDEEPGLILQRFGLILVHAVEGSRYGERAIVGGPLEAGVTIGGSEGRGLLDIETQAAAAIGKLTGADGARSVLAFTGSERMTREGSLLVAARRYSFSAWCSVQPHYDPPVHLVATGGVGSVSLTWTLPPARWDRYEVVLRRAAGGTPPSGPTAGQGVTLSGLLATSKTDSGLAPGTYSYAIFGGYDETGAAASQRYSSQVLGTTRSSVTVT